MVGIIKFSDEGDLNVFAPKLYFFDLIVKCDKIRGCEHNFSHKSYLRAAILF